jgi:hypothetical protein
MLILDFEGWFQMRMATDPDPTDELRGVSGYTFAFCGEPDLDHKLHLQPDEDGVWERDCGPGGGPKVGVTVTSAQRDGKDAPELVGGRIAFVEAQILEHNGLLVRNDYFIINPFRVTLAAGGKLLLDRIDNLNPADPDMPENEATSPMLQRRQATTFTSNSEQVAQATGLPNAANVTLIQNRLNRKASLEALLAATPKKNAVKRAELESRIYELAIVEQWWNLSQGTPGNRPIDRRAAQLALQLSGWNVDMNGAIAANRLGADERYPWNIAFWMGGWDGDAMCGYVQGTWTIPLKLHAS